MRKHFQTKHKAALSRRRILLVNPPVYDFRFEWAQWHQPIGLLQLAAYLIKKRKDVRLVDCLYTEKGERLPKKKLIGQEQEIEGYKFHKWHFGLSLEKLDSQISRLIEEDWIPAEVYVTTLNSIWWEGARDVIKHINQLLPKAKISLGGAYPIIAPEHAEANSGAHKIRTQFPKAAKLVPDLSLYENAPYATGLFFYKTRPVIYKSTVTYEPRAASKVIKEIKEKMDLGVREFVFFDEEIRLADREKFGDLLDKIVKLETNAHFVLPGNISPEVITQDLAHKMQRAGVKRIYLRCEWRLEADKILYTTPLKEYERCVKALVEKGGFEPRTGSLAAMLVIGFPYEDLNAVGERLMQLGHIVGAVIPVPFQYVPGLHKGSIFDRALAQNGHFQPEHFNSKTFPMARLSGRKLEDYLEFTRLASLLNSKYRSETFDFLSESLASKMFRESIRTEGWNPFANVAEAAGVTEDESAQLPLLQH